MASSDDPDEAALFAKYLPVAKWVAHQYANGWSLAAEWADVYADAALGVLDAIRRFDPARSITQRAYVFIRARGAAIDGIRQRGYVTRTDRRVPLSLDVLRAAVVDDEAPWEPSVTERGYDRVDDAATIPLLLIHLSPRRRFVIEAYYLAGRTLADIGAELGVTESRVSQIHTAALRQMRGMLAE